MGILIAYLLGIVTAVNSLQKPKMGNRNANNTDNQRDVTPLIAGSTSEIPSSIKDKCSIKKKRKRWQKNLKFWSEPVGVLFLIVYAATTIAIWCANKKAADAAKSAADTANDSLIRSQRPWVGLAGPIIPQQFQLTPEVSVQTTIPIKNFGVSPALKVMAAMEPVGNKELHQRAPDACDLILRLVNGTIPENQLRGPQIRRGFTLFPGEIISENIGTGNSTLKPESIDTLYFIGCIAYRDQFDKTHTTHFCVETPWLARNYKPGQPLISCSVYNEAD